MRTGKFIPFLAGILVISLLAACFGGGDNNSLVIMKGVPVDSTFYSYWDVKTLGTRDASLVIYEKFKDSEEVIQLTNRQSGIEVLSRSDINYVGRASGSSESNITVFTGELDLVSIKRELDGREDYKAEIYQKATIWTPENTELYKAIGIIDNSIMMGDRESLLRCIDVIVLEPARSLENDKNISLVMDRLPKGVLMQVYKSGIDPVTDSEEMYPDLEAYGKSYTLEGENELKLTAVYMFEDYAATGSKAQDEISAYHLAKGFRNIKVERLDEKYLKVRAAIYIDDFTSILIW